MSNDLDNINIYHITDDEYDEFQYFIEYVREELNKVLENEYKR